jgi:MFS transporter, MHS family, shikimate and dehydroshikimate transport protein
MGSEAGGGNGQVDDIRKVGLASFLGALTEWYDFFLYGLAASLVFAKLYFPSGNDTLALLASFATFGVGFFARPVGGVIFGNYGDKLGRKQMLVLTLLIMGVATFLIGLLPTYESIGILAPIGLVVLRIVQGIGVGGEWGGAVLMVTEHAPGEKRGYFGSWPQMGSSAALLLATGLFTLMSQLPEDDFLSWGWRVPFLLSLVLVAVGLFIRVRIAETPVFEAMKETGEEASTPVVEAVREHKRSILLVIGMRVAENSCGYLVTVFGLAYVTEEIGLSDTLGLIGVMLAASVQFCLTPVYGAVSDRVGRRPVYMFGAAFLVVFAFPCSGCSSRRRPRSCGSPSCSPTRSATGRCSPRSRRSSPSCSVPRCATAASRSATSSRRCSPAAWRRSSRRRCSPPPAPTGPLRCRSSSSG